MGRVESVKNILDSVAHFLRAVTWKEEGPDGVGAGNPSRLSERVKVMASQVDKVGAEFEAIAKENQELKEEVNQLRSQLDPEVWLGKRKEREEEEGQLDEGVKRPCVEEAAATPKPMPQMRTYPVIVCHICDRKFIFEAAFQAHLKTHQDRDAQPSASSTSEPGPQHGQGHDQGGEEKLDTVVLDVSSDDDEPEKDIGSQNKPKKPESQPLENSGSQVVGGESLIGIPQEEGSSLVDSSTSSGTGTGLEGQDQGNEMEIDDENLTASVDDDSNLKSEEGGDVEMQTTQQQLVENSFRVESEIQDQTQQQGFPPIETLGGFQRLRSHSPPVDDVDAASLIGTPSGNHSPVNPGTTSTADGGNETGQDNTDGESGQVLQQESTPAPQDVEEDRDLVLTPD